MSLENKFRQALETVGTMPCTCKNAGTCASCVAIKALVPAHLGIAEDQSVTISIDGQDGESETIFRLARIDNKFPLITDDPTQATNEMCLRMLEVLIETVKDSDEFATAVAKTGFSISVRHG